MDVSIAQFIYFYCEKSFFRLLMFLTLRKNGSVETVQCTVLFHCDDNLLLEPLILSVLRSLLNSCDMSNISIFLKRKISKANIFSSSPFNLIAL